MGMGTGQTGYTSTRGDIEITGAAVRSYGKLMVATGGRVAAHAIADGGMICEDRTRFARPAMWRILPDGTVLPDRRYNFVRRGFITTALPAGV